MQPPSGRCSWRPVPFFLGRPYKHGNDRAAPLRGMMQRWMIGDPQVLSKPDKVSAQENPTSASYFFNSQTK